MYLKNLTVQRIEGIYEGESYDLDLYQVEMKTPLSTQEFSIAINHTKGEISGDCIRYGSWDDLIDEEIIEIIEVIEGENKIARPYKGYKIKE